LTSPEEAAAAAASAAAAGASSSSPPVGLAPLEKGVLCIMFGTDAPFSASSPTRCAPPCPSLVLRWQSQSEQRETKPRCGRPRVRFSSQQEPGPFLVKFWICERGTSREDRHPDFRFVVIWVVGGDREGNAELLVPCWRQRSWSSTAACPRGFLVLLARCGAGSRRSPRLGQHGGGLLPHADCRPCPQRWVLVAWNDFASASTHTTRLPPPGAGLERIATSHRPSAGVSTRLRGGGAGAEGGGGGGGGGEERVLVLDVDNCLYNEATAGIERQIVEGIHRFCAG
jgi:hypothetical protein